LPRRNPSAKRANRENPRIDRNPSSPCDETRRGRRVELIPRNLGQERYIDALLDASKPIVVASGPAGCGKTYLCTLFAIKMLHEGLIERIIITRPAVSNGEELGALPGTLIEKMAPWTRPLIDVFREFYSAKTIINLLQTETVEICPLGFMRGRTFKNSIVIFDEAQNSLIGQMKMCLTRIGEGTRMFITGDLGQTDHGYEENGMRDFLARLKHDDRNGIAVCYFGKNDVERHPIIETILRLYDA
jgi:phosphate starvation-inducible PhoH-like protein